MNWMLLHCVVCVQVSFAVVSCRCQLSVVIGAMVNIINLMLRSDIMMLLFLGADISLI